jgi:anti-sigma factor RsiW
MNARVVRLDPAAHKVADALMPWYVNDTLDREERAFVERHVAECPRCKQEAEWLRGLYAACVAGEASPAASSALRKLRRKLEAPRARQRGPARLWRRERPWTHWLIGAQLVLIAGLGALWIHDEERAAPYRTLGAASTPAPPALVVVFDPATSEAEMRRVLREADARVVDGPTQSNAYLLDVPPAERQHALQALRSERVVTFAEDLGPRPR